MSDKDNYPYELADPYTQTADLFAYAHKRATTHHLTEGDSVTEDKRPDQAKTEEERAAAKAERERDQAQTKEEWAEDKAERKTSRELNQEQREDARDEANAGLPDPNAPRVDNTLPGDLPNKEETL